MIVAIKNYILSSLFYKITLKKFTKDSNNFLLHEYCTNHIRDEKNQTQSLPFGQTSKLKKPIQLKGHCNKVSLKQIQALVAMQGLYLSMKSTTNAVN